MFDSNNYCSEALADLLKLGESNAEALEVTFGAFYKLGLSVSFFLRNDHLLHVNAHLRNEVGHAFRDLLNLVSDAAVTYRNKIRGIYSSASLHKWLRSTH